MSQPSLSAIDILGLGTLSVDDFLHVDAYPAPDGKAEVWRKARECGGLVGTALAAAASLGASCVYGGVLGRDELSQAVRAALGERGIDTGAIIDRDGAGPVHSVIVVGDATGTRNIFFNQSCYTPLTATEVREDLIARARVVFIDQYGPEGALRAIELAHRHGVPVVADMESPEKPRVDEMLAGVDHLIVPADFAARVTGEANPARAAAELHLRRPRACTVVTCGAQGCHFISARDQLRHQPAWLVEPVETTGCGDVFHGAYCAALATGATVPACIARATAAAALYAGRPSRWACLPSREEVESGLTALPELQLDSVREP